MATYSIIARDKPDGLEQRQAIRPEHLKHLERLGDKLLLAGPFLDENGAARGSFLLITADSQADAEAMYAEDPYVKNGLFGSHEISAFSLTINKTAGH